MATETEIEAVAACLWGGSRKALGWAHAQRQARCAIVALDRVRAEDTRDGWELVRIASEIIAKLEAEGSEPVHVIGIERHGDGTLDLTFRTVDLHIENEGLW